MGPVQIWQQGYHNNVYHFVLKLWLFWLTLGRSLHYFLVFLFFNSEYSLFIVNVIKCYFLAYLCKNIKYALYLRELLQYINLQLRQWLAVWGNLPRYLSISCYGNDVIFNFYYFIEVCIWKTCSITLMRFTSYFVHFVFFQCRL